MWGFSFLLLFFYLDLNLAEIKLDTRSLILKEATQLFSEKGFEGVSMRD
ncbi:MAG: helix-turn-helix transcriptional regulator, partial [Gammaproteobacteria bacterium]|nr:helix-turn-helix transcriptional regulator [Gammaproteobacteria bacterium]